MTDEYQVSQLLLLLDKLQAELKALGLWSNEIPSADALESTKPFCCDTLTFTQWLQFVFIPRLHSMVLHKQQLPKNILVSPIAEESFQCQSQLAIIDIIADIDELLSGGEVGRPWQKKIMGSAK